MVITAETTNGIKASCEIIVKAENPEILPVIAAVTAEKNAFSGNIIPFGFQLGNMKKVATVSFNFEKDDVLQYSELIGKNGFTPLGIKWNDDNTATIALLYLQNGAGGSVTKAEFFDVAEIWFKEILEDMPVGIKLVDVSAAGYDENGDGVVDLLDITYCQKYYRRDKNSSGWNDFMHCGLDGNGLIDIQDLIIILKAI